MLTSFAFTLVLLASPPAEGSAKTSLSAWDQGRLELSGEWKSAREATSEANAEYLARREKCPSTAAGHLKLAQWCRSKRLLAECTAHLRVAEKLDPSLADVQKMLGRTQRGGRWGTPQEHAAKADLSRRIAKANADWCERLSKLPTPPGSIPSIEDPLAIPAFERFVSKRSEEGARLVVSALRRMSQKAASSSLARHAAYSRWASVREEATTALSERPSDHSYPLLIQWLRDVEWSFRDGEFGATVVLADVDATIVFNPLRLSLQSVEDSSVLFLYSRAGQSFAGIRGDLQSLSAKGTQRAQDNASDYAFDTATRQVNARAALKRLSGLDFGEDPDRWMRWYAKETGYHLEDQAESGSTQPTYEVGGLSVPLQLLSCFAAGTPVWTRRGLVPIDHIRPGDLVLSRSSNTGELAYKPVVHRTLRPRTQTRVVEASGEKIQTTLGHPFFVAGSGWTKANDLTAKQTLVTVEGTAPIASISEGSVVQAYNLEVADFASYFVGKTGILVHDNTPIRDEPRAMPGMAAAR